MLRSLLYCGKEILLFRSRHLWSWWNENFNIIVTLFIAFSTRNFFLDYIRSQNKTQFFCAADICFLKSLNIFLLICICGVNTRILSIRTESNFLIITSPSCPHAMQLFNNVKLTRCHSSNPPKMENWRVFYAVSLNHLDTHLIIGEIHLHSDERSVSGRDNMVSFWVFVSGGCTVLIARVVICSVFSVLYPGWSIQRYTDDILTLRLSLQAAHPPWILIGNKFFLSNCRTFLLGN